MKGLLSKIVMAIFMALMASVFVISKDVRIYILLVTWLYAFIYSMCDLKNRAPLMCFLLALFTFLMTRLVIPLFYTNSYITESSFNTISFSDDAYNFMYISLFVAIISVVIGYNIVSVKGVKNINHSTFNLQKTLKIRRMSKQLCYMCACFSLMEVLEKVYVVWTEGYLNYYLGYARMLPMIVYKLSTVFDIVFFIYLATMPSKKEAKVPVLIYMSINFVSLLMGGRGAFVVAFMFMVIYGYIRNAVTPSEIWITKKIERGIIIAAPLMCIGLFLVMVVRGNSDVTDTNMFSLILNFFFSQGSSMQVLGLTYEGVNNFPEDQIYSLGPLINVLNDNVFTHLLGIGEHLRSQTVDIAMRGHSLGNYLTYTYQRERFFMGGGLGSSYIAEAWIDFGYVGIATFSLIYGVVLKKTYLWIKNNIWISALSFIMITQILMAPRSSAISFVSSLISPTYLLVFLFIYLYSRNGKRL